jgi:antibiotic biosynthesis monooxygenase (ABM) superfamily enzyme
MAAAPPYVSYSNLTTWTVAPDDWPDFYPWLQALKGHVQEYPGCQGFDVFVRVGDGGAVTVHCYTTWDTPEQVEAYLERGYTPERLIGDALGLRADDMLVMEKVF